MTDTPEMGSEQFVPMIREATQTVFTTMLDMALEEVADRQEAGDPAPVHGVVALVGIAGTWTGTGRIYCSAEFAQRVANAMLGTAHDAVNEEVLDSVAEVANMVIGNVKTLLEAQLGPLGLGLPTVIFGRNYQARTASVLDWTVVPFRHQGEVMDIRFCLAPTQVAQPPRMLRHEPTVA